MLVTNKTHYFSCYNKVYNVVPDSRSWEFESSRRLSYGQRLYWEYKYCKSVGGQAFFYTFTYNNKSLPHFHYEKFDEHTNSFFKTNFPCFDYNHIRLITNGIISKVLRRKYGSQMRYFVACERGEGKGYRGKGMNPHYHIIFFIFPLSDKHRKPDDVPYKRISPIQFCHLCKCVWQYQSEYHKKSYDVTADYKTAKFGHCEPGDDLGLISDFDALSYVCKYVVKDSAQYCDDDSVKGYFHRITREKGYTLHALYSYYYYLRCNGGVLDRKDFLHISGLDLFFPYRRYKNRSANYFRWLELQMSFEYDSFMKGFKDYYKSVYFPSVVDMQYREYVCKYGSKVRCSKSLGIYGLSQIRDCDSNPHFLLDKSNSVVTQPICLYYYRKKYMDIVRCPNTNNVLYVLNDAGLALKCSKLPDVINKTVSSVNACFSAFSFNKFDSPLWSFALSKDIKIERYYELLSDSNFDDLVNKYSVYRNVYQYRSYDDISLISLDSSFNIDDIRYDYRKFLQSDIYTCDFTDMFLITWIERCDSANITSFNLHPAFSSYIQKFAIISDFLDVYKAYIGSIKKKNFDDALQLRQKVNAVKYSRVNN